MAAEGEDAGRSLRSGKEVVQNKEGGEHIQPDEIDRGGEEEQGEDQGEGGGMSDGNYL